MLKLDPKNTELLNQKQIVLNQSISATEDKLKELKEIKAKADEEMANGTQINEANYRSLQREIINTENKLKKLNLEASNWTQTGRKLEAVGESIKGIGQSIDKIGNSATKKLTLPITALAGLGLTYNAEIEKYTKSFETFIGSAEEAEKVVNKIKEDASKTPFDTTSLIRANQMLISTGENAGDAREVILALGDAVTATGGGNDELTRMASNLQQIKNAGKATAMDIRQFAYAGIDVYGILAKHLGKTTEEIKDMEISYEDLTEALKVANKQGGKYYDAMNKSSKTLTGQMNQLVAEAKSFVGELTEGLVPIAKKVVDKAREMLKSFQNLSDSEKENALRIGLMVAAAGPLIKIFGTLTSGVGSAIKGVGLFSQAIGVMKTGVESSNATVNTLAKVLKGLTSPTGIAVMGITAVAAAIIYLATQETEEQKRIKELSKEIEDAGKSLDDYNKKVDETASKELSQIDNVKKLKKELDQLVDENGKVKKSDESRAKFIIEQLNEALGTEISLTDGQIDNYKKMQQEIDKLIIKKRAEIKLTAEEEKYKKAIEEQGEATEKLKEVLDELGMTYDEGKAKAEEYQKRIEKGTNINDLLKDGNLQLIASFVDADNQVKKHTEAIKNYEDDYAKYTEEKYDEIGKNVTETTKDWTDTSLQTISDSIKEQKKNLDNYKQINKAHNDEISKQNAEQAQKELRNLVNELVARTKRIGDLGKDEIKAWATLANEDYEAFKEGIKSLDSTTQQKLNAVADVIRSDKNIANNMDALADSAQIAFQSNDSTKWGTDMIQRMANGINQKKNTSLKGTTNKTVQQLETAFTSMNTSKWGSDMIQGMSNGINQKKNTSLWSSVYKATDMIKTKFTTMDTSKWGSDMIQGMANGINSKYPTLNNAVKFAAYAISSQLHFSKPDKGILRDYETWMPDMIKGLSETLLDASPILEKSTQILGDKIKESLNISNFDNYSGIKNQIIESTKTVFTTPQITFNVQELDEAKLQQCFNYINRKFGSAY